MHPVLHPGSLVLIDQNRRRIVNGGWANELDRPIYFLEHRSGYRCGWCVQHDSSLLVQPHPSSQSYPEIFDPSVVDIIGQVTGVAMLLESAKRRSGRTAAEPAGSPGR